MGTPFCSILLPTARKLRKFCPWAKTLWEGSSPSLCYLASKRLKAGLSSAAYHSGWGLLMSSWRLPKWCSIFPRTIERRASLLSVASIRTSRFLCSYLPQGFSSSLLPWLPREDTYQTRAKTLDFNTGSLSFGSFLFALIPAQILYSSSLQVLRVCCTGLDGL